MSLTIFKSSYIIHKRTISDSYIRLLDGKQPVSPFLGFNSPASKETSGSSTWPMGFVTFTVFVTLRSGFPADFPCNSRRRIDVWPVLACIVIMRNDLQSKRMTYNKGDGLSIKRGGPNCLGRIILKWGFHVANTLFQYRQ